MRLVHNAAVNANPAFAQLGFTRAISQPWHGFATAPGDPEFTGILGLNREDLFGDMDHVQFVPEHAEQAVKTLVGNIGEARAKWPNAIHGIYNIALLPYWFGAKIGQPPNKYTWSNATQAMQDACMDFFHKIQQPLIDACDVMLPSIYDPYSDGHPQSADIAYMRARVRFAKRFGVPVIPYVWPVNLGIKGAPARLMSDEDFIGGQITAALDEDADGIYLWGGWSSEVHYACLPTLELGHSHRTVQSRARAFWIYNYFADRDIDTESIDWPAVRDELTSFIQGRTLRYARLIALAVSRHERAKADAARRARHAELIARRN